METVEQKSPLDRQPPRGAVRGSHIIKKALILAESKATKGECKMFVGSKKESLMNHREPLEKSMKTPDGDPHEIDGFLSSVTMEKQPFLSQITPLSSVACIKASAGHPCGFCYN